MSHVNPNKHSVRVLDQQLIAGIDKHFANLPSLVLGGVSYAPAELKSIFQGELDAEKQLSDAFAKVRELMGSTRTARAKARALRKLFKTYVLMTAGPAAAQMLADFGIVPNASRPKPETTVKAVAKREATRKARNTMGKKQKQNVKGSVPSTPATPKPA